jgi:hypothetical protein
MGSFPHTSCASKVRGIQNFHMDGQGWSDIAYTALVCPHGFVFEGRWVGIRTAANGTTAGNDGWYAICYLGGEGDVFTSAAKRAFDAAFDYLDASGGAGPDENCHRDHKPTACPGDTICAWVRAGSTPPGSLPPPVPEEDDMPRPVLCRDSANKLWLLDGQTRRFIHDDDVDEVRRFFNPQQDSDGRAFTDLPDGFIHNHPDIGVIATTSLILGETAEDVDTLVGE